MSMSLEMDGLQKLILGMSKTQLNPKQISDLLNERTTPELILLILAALEKNVVDKNLILIHAIKSTRVERDLIIPGLALRYGADPGQYVNSEIGVIHILAYTYEMLYKKTDKKTLSLLVGMLMMSGSGYVSKAFDAERKGGYVKDNSDMFASNNDEKSVKEWIEGQGYQIILPELDGSPSGREEFINKKRDFVNKISLYLNRTDLINNGIEEADEKYLIDPRMMIEAHSTILFKEYVKNTVKNKLWSQELLMSSVNNYNLTSYKILSGKGVYPNYVFINDIMSRMARLKEIRFYLGYTQLDTMLINSIENGVKVDLRQLAYMKSIDTGSSNRLEQAYKNPYWKKTCSSGGPGSPVPNDLKILALALNSPAALAGDSTKADICSYITNMAKYDPDTLKAAAIKRQEIRVSAAATGTGDFIKDNYLNDNQTEISANVPIRICRNRNILSEDPYGFSDAELAFYPDKKGIPWCFTSDMFKQLLSTKKNPINHEPLPDEFILELKNKDRLLDALGLRSSNSITFAEAVDKLSKDDVITNDHTDREIEKFLMAAKISGVNGSRYKELENNQLANILAVHGVNINLLPLSKDHAFATFSIIANRLIEDNPRISDHIFNSNYLI